MSDDLPRKHYPLSAVDDQDQSSELTAFLEQFATDLQGAVAAAAVATIKELADLLTTAAGLLMTPELAETIELLRAIKLLEDAMFQGCPTIESCELDPLPGQPQDGDWFDSHAISTWRDIGDYLVENAGWERHPAGRGRRQFYRPPVREEV